MMTDDLTARLRRCPHSPYRDPQSPLYDPNSLPCDRPSCIRARESADEMDRQAARISELEEALREVTYHPAALLRVYQTDFTLREVARRALEGKS